MLEYATDTRTSRPVELRFFTSSAAVRALFLYLYHTHLLCGPHAPPLPPSLKLKLDMSGFCCGSQARREIGILTELSGIGIAPRVVEIIECGPLAPPSRRRHGDRE